MCFVQQKESWVCNAAAAAAAAAADCGFLVVVCVVIIQPTFSASKNYSDVIYLSLSSEAVK